MLGIFITDYVTRNCVFFFFSSRRRHTRLQGDWSSDVCSSDLCATIWSQPSSAQIIGQTSNIKIIAAIFRKRETRERNRPRTPDPFEIRRRVSPGSTSARAARRDDLNRRRGSDRFHLVREPLCVHKRARSD